MARSFSNKLVAKQVTAITKPGKHSDGNGLYGVLPAATRPYTRQPIKPAENFALREQNANEIEMLKK